MHYVYVFVNLEGKCVYAGQTVDVEKRLRQHLNGCGHSEESLALMRKAKIYYAEVADKETALNIEANLIERLRPKANIQSGRVTEYLPMRQIKKLQWRKWEDNRATWGNVGRTLKQVIDVMRGRSPCEVCESSKCDGCAIYEKKFMGLCKLCGNIACCCYSASGGGCQLRVDEKCKASTVYKGV